MNFTKKQKEVLDVAIDFFGAKKQKIKAIEELSELSVELSKDLNDLSCSIIDEMADAYIMLEQLQIIFTKDVDSDFKGNLEFQIAFKIARLKKRIAGEDRCKDE